MKGARARSLAAGVAVALLAAAPPAGAWLLQAQTNPRLETRIEQSRAIARAYERAFREAYPRARSEAAAGEACRRAHEAAAARLGSMPRWRLHRAPGVDPAAGSDFHHRVPLDGLPAACVRAAEEAAVIVSLPARSR